MPIFTTPTPISVTVDIAVGDVLIVAGDRTDTVVTIMPAHPDNKADVQAAQRVDVDHTPGSLQVKQSTAWHQNISRTRHAGTVAVTIELPAGSHVHGNLAWGTFHSEGRLGECEVTSDYGDIRLGEITDGLRLKGTNGSILVKCAHADVDAKTTMGNIHIAEVIRGTVVLTTAAGEIEVGIRTGTAANLDVRTKLGRVRNTLERVDTPAQYADTVKVRARTNIDDIVIRRS